MKFNSKNYSLLKNYLEELKNEVRTNKENLHKKATSSKMNSLLRIFSWIKKNSKMRFRDLAFSLITRILQSKLKSKPSKPRIKNW